MKFFFTFKKNLAINENTLASDIARLEGKKQSLSIGQIKEVQKILLGLLGEEWKKNPAGVISLIEKHKLKGS